MYFNKETRNKKMETPNVDAVPATGAEGTPSPAVSPKGTPPIEGADQLLSALRGEIKSEIAGVLKEVRGLQSRQDKAENSFTEQLARLKNLTGQGLTEEQALARISAEDADVNWRKNLESKIDGLVAIVGSAGTQSNNQQVVSDVFSEEGLDLKDPRVAPHLVKEYKSKDEMELAAARLRKQLAQTPSPTAAQGASLQGKPEVKQGVEELKRSYISEMRATPRGKAGEATRAALREKFKGQGVPVHEIDLT